MSDRKNRTEVGKIGEDTACKYLEKHGFTIVERNYWKKWGEIDIIATKAGLSFGGDNSSDSFAPVLHFIEVKAITRSRGRSTSPGIGGGTTNPDYEPEENVHSWKLKRLSRAIQTYLIERKINNEREWQVDVITVELDFETRNAKMKILEDIGL